MDTGTTKTCPFCAETIQAAAIVCRYCGRDISAPRRLVTPTGPQCSVCQQPVAAGAASCDHCKAVFSNAPAPVATPPVKKRLSPMAFAGIVVGLIVLSCIVLRVTGLGLALLAAAPGPPIEGQDGRIATESRVAIVAVDTAAYDEQIADAQASDTSHSQARLDAGRIFLVPEGTRVHILAIDGGRYQLRILDGEHAGQTGYVPLTFVKK